MQGQKGVIGSLPESLALDNGSNQETRNLTMWSTGESSSSTVPNQVCLNQVDPKTGNAWSSVIKANAEPHQHEQPSSQLSLGHANNGQHHHGLNRSVSPTFLGMKTTNQASSSSGPVEKEARHLTRKRKASDLNIGHESSRIESSNLFQIPEDSSSSWLHPGLENPTSTSTIPFEPVIPRLGLPSSDNRAVENARRNVRIRISNSRQPDQLPVSVNTSINSSAQLNFLSPYPLLGPNPVATIVDASSSREVSPMLQAPITTRSMHVSSRNRSSSTRANRPVPSTITAPPAVNWNFDSVGGNGNGNGNETRNVIDPGTNPGPLPGSSLFSSRRHHAEFLRRSLLSIDSGGGGGVQNSNLFSRIPPPIGTLASSSQGSGVPPVIGMTSHHPHHHSRLHLPYLRTPDRHLDEAFGLPHMSRSTTGEIERRGRMVSEIRNVMNLIRRREGLRFEDVVILDPSVFYSMMDVHDQHRDMRLDIDNMSYEELLALEERIGNVNTGLTEENVHKHMKQKTYANVAGQPDAIPCCICQEEYKDGDELGELECGHDFHTGCIKQWLLQKKLCPVCKSEAAK